MSYKFCVSCLYIFVEGQLCQGQDWQDWRDQAWKVSVFSVLWCQLSRNIYVSRKLFKFHTFSFVHAALHIYVFLGNPSRPSLKYQAMQQLPAASSSESSHKSRRQKAKGKGKVGSRRTKRKKVKARQAKERRARRIRKVKNKAW